MEAVTQARERQEEARRLYEQECQDAAEAETIFNGAIAGETRKAGDHEGGASGDHGGRLLQGAARPPRRSTEAPSRAFNTLSQHRNPPRGRAAFLHPRCNK